MKSNCDSLGLGVAVRDLCAQATGPFSKSADSSVLAGWIANSHRSGGRKGELSASALRLCTVKRSETLIE